MSQDSFGADPLGEMWYLQGEAEAMGPYTGHVIRQMIEAGSVGASSLVARVGATQWSTVAEVPWFAAYVPARPPVKYAGFWIRLWAYILDSLLVTLGIGVVLLIVGAIAAAIMALFGVNNLERPMPPELAEMLPLVLIIMVIALSLFYYIYFPSTRWQATPGKRLAGIYIIREDGRPVTGLLALGRLFAYNLSSLPLCIGFLMIAFTKQKTGLHDLVCGTRVVWGRP
jgi:uncharacterized RDD family membrane protein YckC